MEIKLTLNKPYIFSDKMDFITECNKQGYEVKEDDDKLYALGLTEEEKSQKEKERIKMLALTAADVERAIYKAKGMDFEDIVEFIKSNPPEGLDIKALKIELKANNFYRGNPYVEQIGTLLGYSSDDLDYLFQNKELPKQPIDDVAKALIEEGLYPPEMAIELSIPKPITQSPPPSFENKQLSEKSLDDIIEATEEAGLYDLPAEALEADADSAEDLNPSAVKFD